MDREAGSIWLAKLIDGTINTAKKSFIFPSTFRFSFLPSLAACHLFDSISLIHMQPHRYHHTVVSDRPLVREEYDGHFLHSDVLSFDDGYYRLSYDHLLGRFDSRSNNRGRNSGCNSSLAWEENSDCRYGERSVKGIFDCHTCLPHRVWTSSVISTEIWFSETTDRNSGQRRRKAKKQSCSYRVLIHSQKCRECRRYVEPKIDVEDFSRKVILALDLWTGNRDAETEQEDDYHPTRPHADSLCHGCEIGVCREGRRGKVEYHSRRGRNQIRSSRYD